MAVSNSIAKKTEKTSMVTEYQSNGETVKLSPQIIKRYLVSGGGTVSDEEVMMFLSMCRFQHLNPFLREAYLIKYGESQPATMVVGKDVLLKRARHNPDFTGMQAGVIVADLNTLEIKEREGTFYDSNTEALLGGWAKVFIKGYVTPFYASVSMEEYIGKKKNGEVNGQWASKPATMIRKVAQAHALREAFPDDNAGLYAPEERDEASAVLLDEQPVVPVDEPVANEVNEKPDETENSVSKTLFGEDIDE